MPAGATLISPWVDLAHSFPSVGGEGKGDYIPANGFIYRPDLVWPPPPDPRNAIEQVLVGEEEMVKDGMDIKIRLEEQVQVSSLSCAIGLCCPDRSPADVLPQPTPQPSSHLARQCRLSRRSATSLHRQCHFATLLCTHLSHIVSSIAVLRWIGASPRRNHGEAYLSLDFHEYDKRLTDCPYSTSPTKPRIQRPTRRRRGFSKTTRRRRCSSRRISLRPRSSCKSLMAGATLRLLSPSPAWPNT
jgi:hypothetical protein